MNENVNVKCNEIYSISAIFYMYKYIWLSRRYFRYSIVIKEKNTFRRKKKERRKCPRKFAYFFQNIFFWSECWIIRFKLVVLKDYCFILNKSKFRLQIDWGGCYWSSAKKTYCNHFASLEYIRWAQIYCVCGFFFYLFLFRKLSVLIIKRNWTVFEIALGFFCCKFSFGFAVRQEFFSLQPIGGIEKKL